MAVLLEGEVVLAGGLGEMTKRALRLRSSGWSSRQASSSVMQ
jgi:hypothetical protein